MKPPQTKKVGKNKKRKAHDELPPAELEEGEVRPPTDHSGPHPHPHPPVHYPPHPGYGQAVQQNGFADAYGPPPGLSEAEVVPVVLELLSWGVHPGFLIQSGVSQAIIAHALQFAHPPPPANPPVAPLQPQSFPPHHEHHTNNNQTSPDSHLADANPISIPVTQASPPAPEPTPVSPADVASTTTTELALLEAKTREALLARKVRKAVAARKALADNVDSFLAAVSQPTTPSPPPATSAEVRAEVPDAGTRQPSPVVAPAAIPMPTYFPRVNRRPAAADFLHANSGYDYHAQPRSVFETDQPSQTVIEMSDSDTSDDEEEEAAVLAMVLGAKKDSLAVKRAGGSGGTSPSPATRPGTPSQPDAGAGAGAAAKQQLEAKEAEIKKVMDRIKQMEHAKKASPGPSTPVEPAVEAAAAREGEAATVAEGLSVKERLAAALAGAEEAKARLAELEGARKKVDELKDERSGLLVEVAVEEAADETRMEIDNAADEPDATAPADFPVPAPAPQPTHFAPYTSSLSSLSGASNSALQSFAARRHGVDNTRALCAFEANGGICRDTACEAIHASAFIASDEDVCAFVFEQVCPGALSAPAKAVWKDGLEKALARVPKPLTLAGGLAAGEVFAKRMAA